MCTNHRIFMVLQWPARILWHFHVESYARNLFDFLCFTMARGHFNTFSCPTGCAATIRFSWFYNGPRSFCGTSMFNRMSATRQISLFYNGPRAFRCIFMARGRCVCVCVGPAHAAQFVRDARVRARTCSGQFQCACVGVR